MDAFGALRLRRRRAALPAHGEVARRGPGALDLRDEYCARAYERFYPYDLEPHGSLTGGRVHEPHGVGFPLLMAPAYAIGGAKGVELLLAAVAALALALAYLLAHAGGARPLGARRDARRRRSHRRCSPTRRPSTPSCPRRRAAVRRGAARPANTPNARRGAVGWRCFALIALLPWLGHEVPAARRWSSRWFGFRAMRAARRPVLAITCDRDRGLQRRALRGRERGAIRRPHAVRGRASAASAATGAVVPARLPRARRTARVALFVDRDYGLLRWAPVLALAFFGAWLLWREQRSGLVARDPRARGRARGGRAVRRRRRRAAARGAIFLAPDALRASGSRAAHLWPPCRSPCRSWRSGCAGHRGWAPCSRSSALRGVDLALARGALRRQRARSSRCRTRRGARSWTCSRCSRAIALVALVAATARARAGAWPRSPGRAGA